MGIVANDPAIQPFDMKCARRAAYRTQVGSGVVNNNDETVEVDATGGASTLTIPPAAQHPGRVLVVKKIDVSANAVTLGITAASGDTIEITSLATQNKYVQIRSNGVNNWRAYANN
jgi:hypothetical protein